MISREAGLPRRCPGLPLFSGMGQGLACDDLLDPRVGVPL
ncbi:hypothetical protein GFS31_13160 [Leptolyngbya sp. BL0902]|nr:hypothetical protein GFS31_13160 [Leptolyngbya sp. BL0902]